MASLGGFVRPGSKSSSSLGFNFDVDRDADERPPVITYNSRARQSLSEQRAALPVYAQRENFLRLIEKHSVVVLVGETGSGKTTQVPQYLHEAGWTEQGYQVLCTQPRRVAAMTVATRVAEEMDCELGTTVGFSIRFQNMITPGVTRIKFSTDGQLLRELMSDPLLSAYSVVIVDEAHERSMSSDLLLGLLRKVLRQRPELRVVVSSATIQADKVAAFFAHARPARAASAASAPDPTPAVLTVHGRVHPVQLHYLQAPCLNYLSRAVEAVVEIHKSDMPGDILLFVTGQDDVETAVQLLRDEAQRLSGSRLRTKLLPLPLYAGLPAAKQLEVFKPCPRGCRRVVVATNIAETSVTLDGVVYVVDALFAKQRSYNPLIGLECLLIAPISRSAAAQRAGRAGRVRPGHCFRLCTESAFAALPEHTVPEIQRAEMSGAILQLKALGVDNMMTFAWLDAPPAESAVRGLESLHALGAINEHARLTQDVGLVLAEMPASPELGRALLAAADLGCTEEAVTVAAMMSVQSIWAGSTRSATFQAVQERFAVAEGDLVTFLNVWRAWQDHRQSAKWARGNCLHQKALLRAGDIRRQLVGFLLAHGKPMATTDDMTKVVQAFAAGFFMSAARFSGTEYDRLKSNDYGTNVYKLLRAGPNEDVKLVIHESSVLYRVQPQWVVFVSCQQGASCNYQMQNLISVSPELLQDVAPHVFQYSARRGAH